MPAKRFPYFPFNVISFNGFGKRFFTRNYSKPGIVFAVTNKKYLEAFIRNIFSLKHMAEAIFPR